jgi:hypothetical protein
MIDKTGEHTVGGDELEAHLHDPVDEPREHGVFAVSVAVADHDYVTRDTIMIHDADGWHDDDGVHDWTDLTGIAGRVNGILIVTPVAVRGVALDEHGRTVLADDAAEIDVLGVGVVNR